MSEARYRFELNRGVASVEVNVGGVWVTGLETGQGKEAQTLAISIVQLLQSARREAIEEAAKVAEEPRLWAEPIEARDQMDAQQKTGRLIADRIIRQLSQEGPR